MTKNKAQPLPLSGCNIALSGTFSAGIHCVIQAQLVSLGADVSGPVANSTTHLVTKQRDYDKPSAKVKGARERNLFIVSYGWVQECLATNSKVPEEKYMFSSPPVDVPSQSISTEMPLTSFNGPKTVGKINDLAKTTGNGTVKVKTEAKSGRITNNTGAKSFDVKIPLGEGCNPSYRVHIHKDGTIYDASLNLANATTNSNKFYRIQVSAIHSWYL
jgi:poly [ADP-ribose] polymerase